MKLPRFLGRIYFGALLLVLAWCLFAPAAENNTNTATVMVESDAPVQQITTQIAKPRTTLTFGLHEIEALQQKFLDIPLWQFIAMIIYGVLAWVATRLFDWLVVVQLKKVTSRTKTQLDDLIVQHFRGPFKMLILVVFLHLGLDLFQWPLWVKGWLSNGLKLLVAASLTFTMIRVIDLAAQYWIARKSRQTSQPFTSLLMPLVTKTAKTFVLVMAVLVTLDNLGFNIRTLLAGASIGGLALGLAAQDTVANLFGAAAVFIDQPFKIGDRVQLNGIDGTVEEIGLRSTRVRNLEGHLITVPNKTMGNSTITNITRRPNIRTIMNIGVTYDTPVEKVQRAVEIIQEIYSSHPMTHDLVVGFNTFADSALNINVVHWWKGLIHKDYVAGMNDLNLTLKRRFDQENIAFAFPSRTVYLRQDNDWRVSLPGGNPTPESGSPLVLPEQPRS